MSAAIYQDELDGEFVAAERQGRSPVACREMTGRERYHTQSRHRRQRSHASSGNGLHRRGSRRAM